MNFETKKIKIFSLATKKSTRYKELLLQRKGPDKLKPQKRKLFYLTENEDEAKDIAKNGFKCVESTDVFKNALGPCKSGVHFCKHIDLLLNYQYSRHVKAFYVVLAEVGFYLKLKIFFFVISHDFVKFFKVIITDILLIRVVPVKQGLDPSGSHNIHAVQKLIGDVPVNMPEERYMHSLVWFFF